MQSGTEFLTLEECAEVDKALLTAREKFSARVAIYALRSLKQIAQANGTTIQALQPAQIAAWIEQDDSLQQGVDQEFRAFFIQLVMSSLKPLREVAATASTTIENVTVPQVLAWFEQVAKQRLEESTGTPEG